MRYRLTLIKIQLRYVWRLTVVRAKKYRAYAVLLVLKGLARIDSHVIELFAFGYAASNAEAFDDFMWEKVRGGAIVTKPKQRWHVTRTDADGGWLDDTDLYATDREGAKRVAYRVLGGDPERYVVEPYGPKGKILGKEIS